MTSSENSDPAESYEQPLEEGELQEGTRRDDLAGFEPIALEEIRERHKLDEEWEPRFAADFVRVEEKAEEYRQLGFEAEVYPHPEDVKANQMPSRGDRCVVYTREKEDDDGGMVDDTLL